MSKSSEDKQIEQMWNLALHPPQGNVVGMWECRGDVVALEADIWMIIHSICCTWITCEQIIEPIVYIYVLQIYSSYIFLHIVSM